MQLPQPSWRGRVVDLWKSLLSKASSVQKPEKLPWGLYFASLFFSNTGQFRPLKTISATSRLSKNHQTPGLARNQAFQDQNICVSFHGCGCHWIVLVSFLLTELPPLPPSQLPHGNAPLSQLRNLSMDRKEKTWNGKRPSKMEGIKTRTFHERTGFLPQTSPIAPNNSPQVEDLFTVNTLPVSKKTKSETSRPPNRNMPQRKSAWQWRWGWHFDRPPAESQVNGGRLFCDENTLQKKRLEAIAAST